MKFNIPLFLLSLIVSTHSFSQKTIVRDTAIDIVSTRSLYINSGSNASLGSGKSRVDVAVNLPPNTIEWYYSFSTSTEAKGTKNLNLALQLGAMLLDPTGITNSVISNVKVPQGSSIVDVYLLDFNNRNAFINKVDLNGGSYQYYPAQSTMNTMQGAIRVTGFNKGTYFLGLKNPKTFDGVNVTIEVTAIVREEIYIDEWTEESKALIMSNCMEEFNTEEDGKKEVCDCIQERLLQRYRPSQIASMEENEQSSLSDLLFEECYEKTGNYKLKEAEQEYKRAQKALQEAIKNKTTTCTRMLEEADAYSFTNDFSKSNELYKSVLELNDLEPKIEINYCIVYNNMGWNSLLLGDYASSKEFLTQALSYGNDNMFVWMNLAHYNLLNNNYYEAEKIYSKYKRKESFSDGSKWYQVVGDDLKKFESRGLGNQNFAKVRDLLKIKN